MTGYTKTSAKQSASGISAMAEKKKIVELSNKPPRIICNPMWRGNSEDGPNLKTTTGNKNKRWKKYRAHTISAIG